MTQSVLVAERTLPWDERRGSAGMSAFIATEALLFVVLFFAYFYLGREAPRWPPDPPKLTMAAVMLAVLATSSVILHWGERRLRAGDGDSARLALAVTALLGAAFLLLQGREYRERLATLRPSTDAYGSIFYVITGLHGLHVALGIAMLLFVALLPALEPRARPPHRPLHNAALYWHFVDAVWVAIVSLLYVLPHVGG